MIANFPDDVKDQLKQKMTISEIKGYGFTVESQSIPNSGITKKTLMGESTISPDPKTNPTDDDNDPYYEVTVELKALTARFEIGDVVPGTNIENVEIVGVWINNFIESNNVTVPTLYEQDKEYWLIEPTANWMGADTPFESVTLTSEYKPEQYYNAHSNEVNGINPGKVYAFQLFAGSYVPHLILLVKGQYKNELNGKYFLGWLTFNKFNYQGNPIAKVENNVIYKVGLETGITVNAENLTVKPEMKSVDLGINCTITGWTSKNVTPGI